MKVLIAIIICAIYVAAQQDTTQIIGVAKIVRVYDGDTFFADLYGEPAIFGKDLGIRLKGIDTPELNSPDTCQRRMAKQARDYLAQRLNSSCKIELRNLSRDKYFRVDATIIADGVNINDEMITKGYAMAYTGEGPKPVLGNPIMF